MKNKKGSSLKRFVLVFLSLFFTTFLYADKIRDVASVVGVRDNQLIGYGLVVGLDGTGDGSTSQFTIRSLTNLLQAVNVKIDLTDNKSKNIAAVMVTAKLPSFVRQGDKIDVVISSIGDAKSLQGGTLLMTPLKGVDGKIYALAQGPLTIGGMNTKGGGRLNHATVGTLLEGALVEREVSHQIYNQKVAKLSLKKSNFSAAIAVQDKLNELFDEKVAIAIDARTISLKKPEVMSMVEFLAQTLEVNVNYNKEEKVVIDEKTGTVVAGVNIKVDPVVITHGEITLKVEVSENKPEVFEGSMDLRDNTVMSPANNTLAVEKESVTMANITRALQKLGAKPKDIISIIEAMKRAGAIRARVEII